MSRQKKEPGGVTNIAKIWPSTISQEEWAGRVREILQEADRLTAGTPSMQACADLMIWALGVLWTGLSPEVIALSARESLVVGHPVIVAPPVEEQLQHLAERLEEPRRLAQEAGDGVVRVSVTPPVLLERASDTPEPEPAPAVDPAAEPAAEVGESAATPEGVEPQPEPDAEPPAAAANPVAADKDDEGEWVSYTGLRGLCPHGRKLIATAAILKRRGGPGVARQTERGWQFHRERSRELLAKTKVRPRREGVTDSLPPAVEPAAMPPAIAGEVPGELAPEEDGEQEAMAALDQLINDVRATEPSAPASDAEQEAPGPDAEQEDPEPVAEAEPTPEPPASPDAAPAPAPAPATPDPAVIAAVVAQVIAAMQSTPGQP